MSGKLDQSLDQIMQDSGSTGRRRTARPRTSGRRAAQKAKAAIAAPTGGVQKNTKATTTAKAPAMAAPNAPAPARGSSKVIISGLPEDVKEKDLKDYVSQTVGPARSVIITYGPNGRSRGIATVIFGNPASSGKAVQAMNGIKIDNRAIKVEVVFDGSSVPAPAPPKTLAERSSKPKSAANTKENKAGPKAKTAAPAANGTATAKKGKKAARSSRPKKKTADELDAEMQDYFGDGAQANGTAQPAAAAASNGAEPVDEVM